MLSLCLCVCLWVFRLHPTVQQKDPRTERRFFNYYHDLTNPSLTCWSHCACCLFIFCCPSDSLFSVKRYNSQTLPCIFLGEWFCLVWGLEEQSVIQPCRRMRQSGGATAKHVGFLDAEKEEKTKPEAKSELSSPPTPTPTSLPPLCPP